MRNQNWFRLLVVLLVASLLIIGAVQKFDTIHAKKIVITGSGGFELGDNSGSFDLNGKELTLDADDDSSITCDTDDQCEWELGGQDEYVFTAAVFDIGEGTLTRMDLDADNDTSIRSSEDDQINLELGGSDIYTMTATNFYFNGKVLMLDADIDTSITASADDQIDFELAGADQVVLKAVAAADSAATNEYTEIAFTTPVDTTGANTHNALTIDLAIGNATGGTNAVTAIQIDPITDDPQVVEKAINIGDEWDYAIDTAIPIVASAAQWFDDFFGDAVNGTYTEISGSDNEAVQAIVVEQFGVYQLTSGDAGTGTAADLEAVHLGLEWQPDQGALVFEVRLHLDAAVTTARVCLGFTDDSVTVENAATVSGTTITTVANDLVVFCYDTDADTDEWYFIGSASTSDATGNAITGVAPAANVYQTFRIEVDDGCADARGYINGTLEGTLTADACTPGTLLSPFISVDSADTATSQVVDVDYILVGADRD